MGRLRQGLTTAFLFAALTGPAGAAEMTRLQSAEPGDPFALQFSIRWDREQERATISREQAYAPTPAQGDLTELRYSRVKNDLVTRAALALYTDLELHVEVPYSLGDDAAWRFGSRNGIPVNASTSSIAQNGVDAMGRPCVAAPCSLFPVGSEENTVFHGGNLGDLRAGLAWGIFNDQRDDTKPYWLVGLDVTFPTAPLYDPAENRGSNWQSPHAVEAKRGASGEKVWRYDLYTALSRRFGVVDPYFKAHVTAVLPSSSTYSNCDHVAELANPTNGAPAQMTLAAVTNCADPRWKDDAKAKLPFVAGLTFGTELVPFEDTKEDQKVTFDFRVWADYTSSSRFYNELTDASGKLHDTEAYLTMGAYMGLYLRASRWVSLQATASLATRSSHWLSGESLGKGGQPPSGDLSGATPNPDLNPNFDWRYDAPGNRFRISEVSVFSLGVAGVLTF
ncbi:hypothetical protein [Anaeromyxobacter oryzae]|uniref:DUF3570 domain-containing protein n=1 Tax=Anaeromyxobacter oryzae TaxID=2918170 RepID=A0ABN6N459_9BACT|nr:hypothetical protein [Anaeromyxobacter oryzae]BDG06734.1 hypothetical protein AMOR_57300 [Anaeromyxobacter oryzae]